MGSRLLPRLDTTLCHCYKGRFALSAGCGARRGIDRYQDVPLFRALFRSEWMPFH